MPIYEYRCTACGHQQEFMQKLSDAPITVCTKCSKPTFSKMLTAAGFQLKGSGWYATDFKSKGSAPAAKESTQGGEKKGDGGGEKQGDGGGEKKGDGGGEKKGDGGGAKKADTGGEAPKAAAGAGGAGSSACQ